MSLLDIRGEFHPLLLAVGRGGETWGRGRGKNGTLEMENTVSPAFIILPAGDDVSHVGLRRREFYFQLKKKKRNLHDQLQILEIHRLKS